MVCSKVKMTGLQTNLMRTCLVVSFMLSGLILPEKEKKNLGYSGCVTQNHAHIWEVTCWSLDIMLGALHRLSPC